MSAKGKWVLAYYTNNRLRPNRLCEHRRVALIIQIQANA